MPDTLPTQLIQHAWELNPSNVVQFLIALLIFQMVGLVYFVFKIFQNNIQKEKEYITVLTESAKALEGVSATLTEIKHDLGTISSKIDEIRFSKNK